MRRLIVCSTREQTQELAEEFPDDHRCVVGDKVLARVSGIVDRTFHTPIGTKADWERRWWTLVETRVRP